MLTGNLEEVAATAIVTVIYLVAVRILDLNEREPLWSVLLVFALGGMSAGILSLVVSSVTLELDIVAGAVWREAAVFIALSLGVWILSEVGRMRGWSEVTDVVDGLVYGMAAGLGFAAGDAFARGIGSGPVAFESTTVAVLAKTALAGLAQGVFGAIIGLGFGLAASWRARPRWIWPVVGLALAIVSSIGHHWLAYGNALGGGSAVIRGWIALIIPLILLGLVAFYELVNERRIIAHELAGEVAGGYVTGVELGTLQTFWRRQLDSIQALTTGNLRRMRGVSALHNRQVMLALAKRRAGRLTDARAQEYIQKEIAALRRSITALRSELERPRGHRPHGSQQ